MAILAAAVQGLTIPDPEAQMGAYLVLWVGAAVVSGLAAGLEMMIRARTAATSVTRELTWLAIEQFCPCLVAGALVTVVVLRAAPESAWILPGLWQIFFGLGIFASCRLLPRPTFWVGVFYLGTGLAVLALGQGEAAAFSLGDGPSLRRGPDAGRRRALSNAGARSWLNPKSQSAIPPAGSPTTAWSASSTRRPGSAS